MLGLARGELYYPMFLGLSNAHSVFLCNVVLRSEREVRNISAILDYLRLPGELYTCVVKNNIFRVE